MASPGASDIAFVICVERGRFFNEALLLVESLRTWGGALAQAPVHAVCPRPDEAPDQAGVAALRELGAEYSEAALAHELGEPSNADKISACAFAERELDHERLVFVDSDTLLLGEPDALLGGDWVAAARPVDRRIAGSRGKGKNEPFWQRMYEALGVRSEPFVKTGVGGLRIRAYWNTGLLAVRRDAGLFGAWENAFRVMLERGIVHRRFPYFTEQMSWAPVVADLHDRVLILPSSYNYALRHRGALEPEARELDLHEIVHLHYRLAFHVPNALERVHPPFDPGSERYAWLAERLPVEPVRDEAD